MSENPIATMPALALRGLAVFPNMLLHFDVGRRSSIKALDEAMSTGQNVFLVAQRDLTVEEPRGEDLYAVGTVSSVRQLHRLRHHIKAHDAQHEPGGEGQQQAGAPGGLPLEQRRQQASQGQTADTGAQGQYDNK